MGSAYDNINNVLEFINQMGADIAKSSMFGCETEHQGRVMAMECLARKMAPLQLAERYHIIMGSLSMKSEAMLAEFRRLGGEHTILKREPDFVSIRLSKDGQSQDFELKWDNFKNEPTPYVGKEDNILKMLAAGEKPNLKPKYATPHSRMQMLWARLISDSVGAFCPEVRAGQYTPEEVADFRGLNVENEVERIVEEKRVAEEKGVVEPAANESDANDLIDRIKSRFEQIPVPPEKQEAILQKRGVNALRSLTVSQLHEILEKLNSAWQKKRIESGSTSETAPPTSSDFSEDLNAPIPSTMVDEIKAAIGEANQQQKGIAGVLVSGLKERGLKLADLTIANGRQLLERIQARNASAFFEGIEAKN